MNRWFCLLLGLLLLVGLGPAAPGQAKEKLPDIDLDGLVVLLGAEPAPAAIPAPTPSPAPGGIAAVTPAPAPAAAGELTLDRFALGFGLVVVGAFGVALAVLAMRRLRGSLTATLAQQGDAAEKKNP
jgi:hypothetical protein